MHPAKKWGYILSGMLVGSSLTLGIGLDLYRKPFKECAQKYAVYSCSLKPDYSAFKPERGVQI